MASIPLTAERELGRIETRLTVARDILISAGTDLKLLGHDDSSREIDALLKALRRLREITRERMA